MLLVHSALLMCVVLCSQHNDVSNGQLNRKMFNDF